ncbi:NADH-quinone oxidoreductase subunit NuoE [Buchnera aphidicola (Chaitoregma tattakana)]|uniref:NADH-quinone oxidoreductase subunit NuoE n=1 Tax=Buchnera aphidicola TaxID=9 RepID=UPI0031B84336
MKEKNILNNKEQKFILTELKKYEDPNAAVVECLKYVQQRLKWISLDVIKEVSQIVSVPVSKIESIATFYSQIFRQPVGKNIIKYCDGVVCYINGYKKIEKTMSNYLKITPGNTTKDKKFTLIPICCLGNCDNSPTIMINENLFSNVTNRKIINILENLR